MDHEKTFTSADNTIRTLANPQSAMDLTMLNSPGHNLHNSATKEVSLIIPANTEFKIQTARKTEGDSEQKLILTLTSPSNQLDYL